MDGSVVENGSGAGTRIEGYRIGGKTGTSQKAKNGIYTSKKVCSFVATLLRIQSMWFLY